MKTTKLLREHRKELKKLAKETFDYDWMFLDKFVELKLLHMLEYYEKECTWLDEINKKKIINELHFVIDMYDLINCGSMDIVQEAEMRKKIYHYLAEHLQNWWD